MQSLSPRDAQVIQSVLERMEDRITEIVKAFTNNQNVDGLEFDLDLLDKDIEMLKDKLRHTTVR